VFEAVKRWRRNKTTIVITHDLSQISPSDFAYVLREGSVVECGYRADLEVAGGEFQQMAMTQAEAGGFAVKEEQSPEAARKRDSDAEKILGAQCVQSPSARAIKRESMAIQPITVGNWMFDVVSDLTRNDVAALPTSIVAERETTHLSRFVPVEAFTGECPPVRQRRPSTLAIDIPLPSPAHTTVSRRLSLQFSPISPVYSIGLSNSSTIVGDLDSDDEKEKGDSLTRMVTSRRRFYDGASGKRERKRWDSFKLEPFGEQAVKTVTVEQPSQVDEPQGSIYSVIRAAYPSMPHKPLIGLGIVFAIISGSITPIFSFMLSRLLFEVSNGAQDVSVINTFGSIILMVAIADGLFVGLKFIVFESAGQLWVSRLRTTCYRLVLSQDKRWFDRSENAASRLCQVLTRDGDDARSLISAVIAQSVVVVSMLAVGLIWALVRGWQLTLVGFAIAPVFIVTMVVQSRLVAKCELRNKRAREEVAKGYYDVRLELLSTWLLTDCSSDSYQYSRHSRHGFRECFPRALQRICGECFAYRCSGRLRRGLHLRRCKLSYLSL
jgi:ATP-binding cassette subfamily B (MDR/TAP) protein 1